MTREMEQDIINYVNTHNWKYIKIESDDEMKMIHNLLINDNISDPTTEIEYLYYGFYYHSKMTSVMEQDIINYVKTHNRVYIKIESGDEIMMIHNLLINDNIEEPTTEIEYLYYGFYYEMNGNIDNMIKYYKMAIIHKNSIAMNNLGCYYKRQGDIVNMLKYHEMAIKYKNLKALERLINYYKRDLEYMNIIYILPKINNMKISVNIEGSIVSAINLFLNNSDEIEQPDEIIKIICDFDFSNFSSIPYGIKLIQSLYKTKIDTIELHFKYMHNGDGMIESKNDFINRICNK